jgi:hypothetical protein
MERREVCTLALAPVLVVVVVEEEEGLRYSAVQSDLSSLTVQV